MDITNLNPERRASESPVKYALRHPGRTNEILRDENGQPLEFEVWHRESTVWRNAELAEEREEANSLKKYDSEDKIRKSLRVLAACTVTIPNALLLNGEKPKDALSLFNSERWIADQLYAHCSNRANLFLE